MNKLPCVSNRIYPNDPQNEVPDGKEEFIAQEAMEIRFSPKRMKAALEWDGEQTGSDDLYSFLAAWMKSHSHFDGKGKQEANLNLHHAMCEIAEKYAEEVLWPARNVD